MIAVVPTPLELKFLSAWFPCNVATPDDVWFGRKEAPILF